MYPSIEVRWFVEGDLPKEAAAWFDGLGPAAEAKTRTDLYLPPHGPDEPGLKVREGRLEVKRRTRTLGLEAWADGRVEGRVEAWRKWSFPLANPGEERAPGWIEVEKTRRTRTFGVGEGQVEEKRGEERTRAGAHVELSALRLGGRASQTGASTWWSVCVEAFGPDPAARHDALRMVSAHIFRDGAPPRLTTGASMGYPAWLSESAGEERPERAA